jgi:hypothetical protein
MPSADCGSPPLALLAGWGCPKYKCWPLPYRFAWPRAIFLIFGFFDPRG